MPPSAAGRVRRGGDAITSWTAVGGNANLAATIFGSSFNVEDGGAQVDVSTFDDGRSGNYFTVDECNVTITRKTWFPDHNPFDAPYLIQKNAEYRVTIFPDKGDPATYWLFTNLKVLNITHEGQSGREGLQPFTIKGFARTGYFYPQTTNSGVIGPAVDG